MSEGTHFYDAKTGEPFYLDDPRNAVTCKNGNTRQPWVKEALAWGKFPSVTTADIRMKWGLVNWMQEQAVGACYDYDAREMYTKAEYVEAVMRHLQETRGERSGSSAGSEIHSSIEAFGNTGEFAGPYAEHSRAAVDEALRLFPDVTDWKHECSFASPEGHGGKVDLHSPSTGIVVDFKSFDGEAKPGRNGLPRKVLNGVTKGLVFDQNIQLAAYHRGLCLPPNKCANVFVSRTHPGVVSSRIWNIDMLAKGWDIFRLMLQIWYLEHDTTPQAVLAVAQERAA